MSNRKKSLQDKVKKDQVKQGLKLRSFRRDSSHPNASQDVVLHALYHAMSYLATWNKVYYLTMTVDSITCNQQHYHIVCPQDHHDLTAWKCALSKYLWGERILMKIYLQKKENVFRKWI